ncbi:hypothetical protein B0J12DRAFT_706168 [Macrophomina phaseolina]|uniref:Protein kinase domain-containing protein n=1 Tax=Macrophomina phaseolina TaxID=35725 RepID=A0ABQ8FPV4_9PEZI|nr:hypothetical protein B0J12DRAFT_706168 [Macrophomina phaseolina]
MQYGLSIRHYTSYSCTRPTHAQDGATIERTSTSSQPDTTSDGDGTKRSPVDQKEGNPDRSSDSSDTLNESKMLNSMQSQLGGARRPLSTTNKPCRDFADDPLVRPLRLPIISNSRFSIQSKLSNAAFQISVRHEDPAGSYEPMLYLGTNKNVIVALSRVHPFRCVQVIKQRSIAKTTRPPDFMWDLSHPNITKVREAFYYQGRTFTVYDYLELSLESLRAIPVTIEEHHVASIALQVLEGLNCIESAFQRQRGFIKASTILFAKNGSVKIVRCVGNVADVLQLSEPQDTDTDTKALGKLLEDLREDWLLPARAFFEATRLFSCEELLKYHFVNRAPKPSCLQRYVNIGKMTVNKEWGLAKEISSVTSSSESTKRIFLGTFRHSNSNGI